MRNIIILTIILFYSCNKKNDTQKSNSTTQTHSITFKAWGGPGNTVIYDYGNGPVTVLVSTSSSWQLQKEVTIGTNVTLSASNTVPGTYVGTSILDNGNQVAYLVNSMGSSVSYIIK